MTPSDTQTAPVARQGAAEGTTILAIDPGCRESAWCLLAEGTVTAAKTTNISLLALLRTGHWEADAFVVEMVAGSYGAAVGVEIMQTAVWTGRFLEAWEHASGEEGSSLTRQAVKAHLCGTAKAGDSHVRQALIDHWGGDSVALARATRCPRCKGRKTTPDREHGPQPCWECRCSGVVGADGPLRGIKNDEWAALAVAVTLRALRGRAQEGAW